MKRAIVLTVLIGLVFLFTTSCFSQETKAKCFDGIEVLTGFSWGKIHTKDNYNLIPLSIAFDFNLKPLAQKINFNPKQLFQFQIEPFVGLLYSPESDFETGVIFWLKMGLVPDTWKFQPYVRGGVGADYMTLHTREQSTQFNFTEQGAIGAHYYLTQNTALTLEGRIRHLSNSGIKTPNHGINTYSVMTGIAYKF